MKKAIIYLAIFLGTCWVASQLLQFVSDMLGDLGFSATLRDDAVWSFATSAACLFVAFKCLSPNISPKPFLENKHKFAIAGYFLLLFVLIHMIHLCLLLAVTWGEEIGSGKEFWNVETTHPVLWVVTACLIGPFVEEIFFREKIEGQLLQSMNRPWVAVLLSALIFTVGHIPTYSVHVIFMFPVSLVICWAYYRTGTIWVGFVIHCLKNIIAFSYVLVPEMKETVSTLFIPQDQPANGDTYLWMAEVVLICLAIFAVWRINLLTKESKITYEIEPATE
ncbi:MAG: CPBP family intramembrane metalloprotease [Bacteroidales bacterium]|nr:CPBP family intramembrane metalloprotease [Bacteroidales bacterium]